MSSQPEFQQGQIGFEHKGIGAVLASMRLAVPLNQREYKWEEEHVEALLQDFSNAIDNNRAVYFLGTIVLTTGERDIPEVSDGQQRLATTSILLAAIRDYFFRENDMERARAIETKYLRETDFETTQDVPKLQLNVDDREFFKKFVIASPDSKDRKTEPSVPSHLRIKKAVEMCAQHVRDITASYNKSDKVRRLFNWVNFVKDGAQVIVLRVPDHLNTFIMFETLNDRGLRAGQADLVKNELLKNAGADRIREAQQRWAQMIGTLQSLGQDDGITVKYLHHFLILSHGPTKEREVLRLTKSDANSQTRALNVVEQLASRAVDYAALFNSDHSKWNNYGTSLRHNISTINRDLRVEQIRPLMFAVATKFSVKEAKIAFRLFVFWSVRFLIVGGRGGLLDRNYSQRAEEIMTGKITTAKELAAALADILPSDALFTAAFREARVSQSHLARYYLRALERQAKGQSEPEFVPMDDEQFVNLEHVLPENPAEGGWPKMEPELSAANHKRIGNLVILQAKQNSIIGNSSFADKRKVLKESAFILTKEVAKQAKWGVPEIHERQERLADLAIKTWPLKIA